MDLKNKFILDACCGGRMFWFNKTHPNTIYIDKRRANIGHIKHTNPNHEVNPDILMDFTNMKFPDKIFYLVVFDPPHVRKLNMTSNIGKMYGSLCSETWQSDLKNGFNECWRVLQDYGILIFKWNEVDIPLKKVLNIFNKTPLFGHPLFSKCKTHWMCFMKIPETKQRDVRE